MIRRLSMPVHVDPKKLHTERFDKRRTCGPNIFKTAGKAITSSQKPRHTLQVPNSHTTKTASIEAPSEPEHIKILPSVTAVHLFNLKDGTVVLAVGTDTGDLHFYGGHEYQLLHSIFGAAKDEIQM